MLLWHVFLFALHRNQPDKAEEVEAAPTYDAVDRNIQRQEFPGTHDFYTVPDKSKKTHKPVDHLPTYQVSLFFTS